MAELLRFPTGTLFPNSGKICLHMQPEIVRMSRFTVKRIRATILAPESDSGQQKAFHWWIQILIS